MQVPFGYGPGHIDGSIPNSKREFSVRQLCRNRSRLIQDRGPMSMPSSASAALRPESKLAQRGEDDLLIATRKAVEQNLSLVVRDRQRRNPVPMTGAARDSAGTAPFAAQSADDLLRSRVHRHLRSSAVFVDICSPPVLFGILGRRYR